MARAKYPRTCPGCGSSIEVGAEISKTPAGWMHADCLPDAIEPQPDTYPDCGHIRGKHDHNAQERINVRGALKIRAALSGNVAELDRLAALTPSCLQTEEEWLDSTYAS